MKSKIISFIDTHPEVLSFWDFSTNLENPHSLSHTSKELVAWKCPTCGCDWVVSISAMCRRQTGLCRKGCMYLGK